MNNCPNSRIRERADDTSSLNYGKNIGAKEQPNLVHTNKLFSFVIP